MQTVAILNEKGGTAKTTTSVSLAATLGELGKKVLLVDLDGQAASSRWFGCEEDNRLADALLAGGGLVPVETNLANVWLAPASGRLDSISHELRPTQGGQLRRVLADIKERLDFDYVLIDCPPSLGNRLIGNALLAATHAIVPVEASILALDGLRILLTMLDDIAAGFGHNIELIGALACRYNSRTKLSRLVLAELQRALPGKVFKTCIRETVRMQECPASGKSILEYAPTRTAAEDYRSLAHELVFGRPSDKAFTPDVSEFLDVGELDEEDKLAVAGFHARAAAHLGCDRTLVAVQDQDTPAQSQVTEDLLDNVDDTGNVGNSNDSDDSTDSTDPDVVPVMDAANWQDSGAVADVPADCDAVAEQFELADSVDDDMPSVGEDLVIETSQAASHHSDASHLKHVAVVAGIMLCVTIALSSWLLTGSMKIQPSPAAANGVSDSFAIANVDDVDKDIVGEELVVEVEKTPADSIATDTVKPDDSDSGIVIDWDAVTAKPVENVEPAPPAEPSMKEYPTGLALMSIMGSESHRTAIISDKLCSVGGEVNGARIVRISDDSVEVEYGSFRFVLSSDGTTAWAGPEL